MDVYYEYALLAYKSKLYDDAIKMLNNANDSEDKELLLASIYYEQKEYEKAKEIVFSDKNKNNVKIIKRFLLTNKSKFNICKDFNKCNELADLLISLKEPEGYFYKGYVEHRKGDKNKAIEYFIIGADNYGDLKCKQALCRHYLAIEDYEKCVQYYDVRNLEDDWKPLYISFTKLKKHSERRELLEACYDRHIKGINYYLAKEFYYDSEYPSEVLYGTYLLEGANNDEPKSIIQLARDYLVYSKPAQYDEAANYLVRYLELYKDDKKLMEEYDKLVKEVNNDDYFEYVYHEYTDLLKRKGANA